MYFHASCLPLPWSGTCPAYGLFPGKNPFSVLCMKCGNMFRQAQRCRSKSLWSSCSAGHQVSYAARRMPSSRLYRTVQRFLSKASYRSYIGYTAPIYLNPSLWSLLCAILDDIMTMVDRTHVRPTIIILLWLQEAINALCIKNLKQIYALFFYWIYKENKLSSLFVCKFQE